MIHFNAKFGDHIFLSHLWWNIITGIDKKVCPNFSFKHKDAENFGNYLNLSPKKCYLPSSPLTIFSGSSPRGALPFATRSISIQNLEIIYFSHLRWNIITGIDKKVCPNFSFKHKDAENFGIYLNLSPKKCFLPSSPLTYFPDPPPAEPDPSPRSHWSSPSSSTENTTWWRRSGPQESS